PPAAACLKPSRCTWRVTTRLWTSSVTAHPEKPPMNGNSPAGGWDRDRFYRIDAKAYPAVTTILDVIAKPALGPWHAQEERRFFETAMLEVLARPGARDPEYVLSAVAEAVTGVKAADREKQRAATIGTAVHAGIEWHLRRAFGDDPGPEPLLPDAALW